MRISIIAIIMTIMFAAAFNGCSGTISTAKVSDLRFGKNSKADPQGTKFNTGEDIYALAAISTVPDGKHKLTWKITYDDVEGKEKGSELGTNTVEFQGSKQLWQSFSARLPGQYKVAVFLSDADGNQLDTKSGNLALNGSVPDPLPIEKKSSDESR